uniref:Uncharacterized protein n=1 Tax=Ciona savignyi TaxID=51511 RepID=H2ZHQ9_CIOSA
MLSGLVDPCLLLLESSTKYATRKLITTNTVPVYADIIQSSAPCLKIIAIATMCNPPINRLLYCRPVLFSIILLCRGESTLDRKLSYKNREYSIVIVALHYIYVYPGDEASLSL